jgi:hypothetical protein
LLLLDSLEATLAQEGRLVRLTEHCQHIRQLLPDSIIDSTPGQDRQLDHQVASLWCGKATTDLAKHGEQTLLDGGTAGSTDRTTRGWQGSLTQLHQ